MSKKRILIVDDEPDLCDILRFNLEAAGYEVLTARSADEAISSLGNGQDCGGPSGYAPPDLLLLDVMMPGISGFELAHRLKADARAKLTPIIFLTALDSEDDLLQGFQLGADDYIAKPFSVREVLARVRAVLARTAQEADTTPVAIVQEADASAIAIAIDAVAKTIAIDGRAMSFTPTEFNLLKMLCDHPGRVFSREELISLVWPSDVIVTTRTVDVNMARIRKKLGRHAQRIVSRLGFGYCYLDQETR